MQLDAETVSAILRRAGLFVDPDQLKIDAREDRWAVSLPGDRMAWFPANEKGQRALSIERKLLRLLGERCAFRVPRLLFESEEGYDLRALVPGCHDPWRLYARVKADATLGARIGHALGKLLAEQHVRIERADVAGWIVERLPWPLSSQEMADRLPANVSDPALRAQIDAVIRSYDAVVVAGGDCVLVHGDLGLHNVAVDEVSFEVNGVFDYGEAAWADRHHDFRYLLFDIGMEEALEAALAAYEPLVGRTLDRQRIRLYNAICAISFLAYRSGVAAEDKSCGRTLAQDLAWVRAAVARLGQTGIATI
jgi:hypothetical protein